MENKKIISEKIKKIKNIEDEELLRYELYSFFTNLLLSTEEFKSNKEIKIFLEKFNIDFKKYVFDSRTTILARTLRKIEKADKHMLKKYRLVLEKLYISDNSKHDEKINSDKISNDKDYVSEILKKYSRNNRG